MTRSLLAATLLCLAMSVEIFASASASVVLTASVDTAPVLRRRPPYERVDVAFAGADLIAKAEILSVDRTRGANPRIVARFEGEDWRRAIRWKIRDAAGTERTVQGSDAELLSHYNDRTVGEDGVLRSGEWRSVRHRLPKLAAGAYAITAEVSLHLDIAGPRATITSEPFTLEVRRGDEDSDTMRAYLRWQAQNIRSTASADRYARFKSVMTELANLEPGNYYNQEEIADVAVGAGALDEAGVYYSQVIAVIDANIERTFGSLANASPAAQDERSRAVSNLAAFDQILPERRHAGTLFIATENDGRKRFIAYRRGVPVRVIDSPVRDNVRVRIPPR